MPALVIALDVETGDLGEVAVQHAQALWVFWPSVDRPAPCVFSGQHAAAAPGRILRMVLNLENYSTPRVAR